MSTEYYLCCKDCKESLEGVGSASISYGQKMWKDDKSLKRLQQFLFDHEGHKLVFVDEGIFDAMQDRELSVEG